MACLEVREKISAYQLSLLHQEVAHQSGLKEGSDQFFKLPQGFGASGEFEEQALQFSR